MTPFRRQQLVGVIGALPGFVTVALTLTYAASLFGFVVIPADNLPARVVFAIHWMLLPGICLLIGVVVAGRRGFIPDAIEGTRTPASRSLEINLRYNQNTIEQTVLACIAWAALSVRLPEADLVLIPAMAALFVVGRAAFWIGYLLHPMGRAFGMVLTVLPTLLAYGWLVWHMND